MLIDLHTHSTAHSACSAVSADELVLAAKASGLDGVCLTEHDAFWPEPLVRELGEKHGIVVLRGVEATTEVGHVLVFGVSHWRKGLATVEALHEFVRSEGGLMFLAHPSRRYGRPVDGGMLGGIFDSLEVENASEGPLQNGNAVALAKKCRLPGIGGSDGHIAAEIGASATRLARGVTNEAELVNELLRGKHKAVCLRPPV